MSKEAFTSAEFYRHLQNKRLMGSKCTACQKVYLPPRPLCIHCFTDDMQWVELSGKGTLQAFTCITVGPSFMVALGHDRKNPYCCGIVALEEGPQVSGQILGINPQEPESIRIGTPLTLEIMQQDGKDTAQMWLGFKKGDKT